MILPSTSFQCFDLTFPQTCESDWGRDAFTSGGGCVHCDILHFLLKRASGTIWHQSHIVKM